MKKMNQATKDRIVVYLFIIFLVFLFFLAGTDACAQGTGSPEYMKWRWSRTPMLAFPDADGLHFVGSAFLAGSFDNSMKWWEVDLQVLGYGVLWECKDALIPYEKAGFIGGEGFSVNDLMMDFSGVVIHRLGVLIYNRIKYGQWELNKINVKRNLKFEIWEDYEFHRFTLKRRYNG